MALEQNPFTFLSEEEDTDVIVQKAKAAAAAAAAMAAKEAALLRKEGEKKNNRKSERISTRAKRIIFPRYVGKRDIIVRKEKPQGKRDANGGNNGNIQQNSVAEAHRINEHQSYNGHVNNNYKGNNNNGVEGYWSKNRSNVNSSRGNSPASSHNGHHHGGSSVSSNSGYQDKYRRGSYGFANNGGRGQNKGFNGNNSNLSNKQWEKKVGRVSNGVEQSEEDASWTKVEKRRTNGMRNGSYDYNYERSSQVSTVSEKETTDDVQVVNNGEKNASEKELGGEVQHDVNAENSSKDVAEAVNGGNICNEAEGKKSNAADEKRRTKKNGSHKRKNKNKKKIEVAEDDNSQKNKEKGNDETQQMTLEEYEKSLLEKRKAFPSLKKTENSRVPQLKDFESMVLVEKKTDDGLSTNQNTKDSLNHKKDDHKKQEKGHKVMVELVRKKCGITFDHHEPRPYGVRRGSDRVGKTDKEPVNGNGAASETEKKQQQPAKGGHVQNTEADKPSGFRNGGQKKKINAAQTVEADQKPARTQLINLPSWEDLKQFPILGGKAA